MSDKSDQNSETIFNEPTPGVENGGKTVTNLLAAMYFLLISNVLIFLFFFNSNLFAQSGQPTQPRPLYSQIFNLQFSPDGNKLYFTYVGSRQNPYSFVGRYYINEGRFDFLTPPCGVEWRMYSISSDGGKLLIREKGKDNLYSVIEYNLITKTSRRISDKFPQVEAPVFINEDHAMFWLITSAKDTQLRKIILPENTQPYTEKTGIKDLVPFGLANHIGKDKVVFLGVPLKNSVWSRYIGKHSNIHQPIPHLFVVDVKVGEVKIILADEIFKALSNYYSNEGYMIKTAQLFQSIYNLSAFDDNSVCFPANSKKYLGNHNILKRFHENIFCYYPGNNKVERLFEVNRKIARLAIHKSRKIFAHLSNDYTPPNVLGEELIIERHVTSGYKKIDITVELLKSTKTITDKLKQCFKK